MRVKLKGKTRHGKNRIKQFGEWWKVERVAEEVKFPTNDVGPWFVLTSVDGSGDWRFVSEKNDSNFEIIETDENI
jgi:hypothetical protein